MSLTIIHSSLIWEKYFVCTFSLQRRKDLFGLTTDNSQPLSYAFWALFLIWTCILFAETHIRSSCRKDEEKAREIESLLKINAGKIVPTTRSNTKNAINVNIKKTHTHSKTLNERNCTKTKKRQHKKEHSKKRKKSTTRKFNFLYIGQ